MRATLSILGMYKIAPTIFDDFNLPDGVNKQDVIDNILFECSELEIAYPQPDTLKRMIGVWSISNRYSWQTLLKTTQLEYNPIWNKDGTITETETHGGEFKRVTAEEGTNTNTQTGTNTQSADSTNTANSETIGQVSAFNSTNTGTWDNKDKSSVNDDGEQHSTASASGESSGTETRTNSRNETETDTRTITHERIESGNIGVTTTQRMIEEERQVARFNFIDVVTESFKAKFCIGVY